jgi:L-lactate dehydrogenase complex protein LldF
MGAVLTPLLAAKEAEGGGPAELAGASTLCGACMEACPVEIPLQDLLLALRRKKATEGGATAEHAVWRAWSQAWSHPRVYRAGNKAAVRLRRLAPLADRLGLAKRWTAGRELPDLAARTFTERWMSGER